MRAYGLGCFFILATLSMVFSLAKRPTWPGFILAAGAAILSVQTLFQNAFLLLAICCGGWMVCAKRRNWKAASQVLGIGVLSALSLLPYVKGIRESQAWWAVQKTGFIPGFVWQNLNTALGSPYDWQVWLWIAAVMAAIVLTLVWLFRREWDGRETAIYFGCTLIVALPSFLFFLWHSQMPTQIWYFLPITVLAAVCVDRTFQTSGSKRFGMLRLTLFTVLLGITIPTTRQNLAQVLTNVDLIANRVAAEASAQDLVILDPWHCGTSFRRYYNGSARWTSIPPLDDYEIQRFDQLRVRMMSGEPIKDLLAACAETLAGGHRVWMVGYGFQIPIAAPASLPPAPASVYGWRDMAYELVWSGQVFHQASMDATGVSRFTTEPALSVSGYEPLECYIFAGKREANAKP